MKRILDKSEALGTVHTPGGKFEVCATADVNYDQTSNQLIARLDSFLRTTDIRVTEKRLAADWLPSGETVTESAGIDDALELGRDIFRRWARKVREATPHPVGSTI